MDFSDYDLSTQEDDLKRRRAVVDALAKQSLNPGLGDVILGMFGKTRSGLDPKEMQAGLARDTEVFQRKQQEQMSGELSQYLNTRQGMPARPAAPDQTGTSWGPDAPAVPANPREAIVRAMTSRLPELQAIGKADFNSLNKVPERKEHVIGNQLVESVGGQARVMGTYNKADWQDEPRTINGQQVQGQRNAQTGEWKPIAPQGQTINIGDKGNAKLMDEVVPVVKGARDSVVQAQQGLDASQRIMRALQDPTVQTGFGASAVNGVASLGAKLGFNGTEGVAKTQALASDLARNTLAAGQTMKGSFSDKDIAFLTDVTLGKVDFTKEALQDIAALAYQANHNTVLNAMDQYKSASGFQGMEGVAKLYPMPPVSWDASISDNPAFQKDNSGRLRYQGSYSQAQKASGAPRLNSQGRVRMTMEEFLGKGQ